MTTTSISPVLTVTERAITDIRNLLVAEDDADDLALWVQITGANGPDYAYDLAFESLDDVAEGDAVSDHDGLRVVIPAASIDALRGATLDLPDDADQGGLVLRNPNKPDPLEGIDLTTGGDLAEQVTMVIDKIVNPMLAQHGGFAQLAGVQDTKVFVLMGGGCHGCSISWLTLKSGITKTIMESVPDVTEVVDVTDHATGENPYFTSTDGASSVASSST
ncbi:MAG TPA: NifU family protein [Acidimicrobiales bacterium]|nr:NifU family protein [Acidimicrobiales bacterium]